jgi:hypothetical protein
VTATPTPRRLYVHDDLTAAAAALQPSRPDAAALVAALFAAIGREPHVTVLSLARQIDGLVAGGGFPPFATTIAIGAAGERVARDVHARTGWFPAIGRVEVTREEDGRGGYVLTSPAPLEAQVRRLALDGPVAAVDDTLFSGLTMRAVLEALPRAARARAHAFCLRAVQESLPAIAALCPVSVGFAAPGRILHDVSFINASGLVRRGAIRRVGASPLAFFERPEWMAAWFPAHAGDVVAICRRLHAAFEGPDV